LLMIGVLQIKTMKANFLRDTELIFNMRPYIKYYVGTFCLCS
jgi:Ca2+-dependent lipid-binding protein